jgi:hypothetical protein
MNDELKAAAARLVQWDSGERPSKIYPDSHDPIEAANNDAWDLARAHMKQMSADETDRAEREKPIDEEWLRSLACGEWLDEDVLWYVEDEDSIGRIVEYCDGPHFWYILGERIWRDAEPTRGQLIALLSALGIESNP